MPAAASIATITKHAKIPNNLTIFCEYDDLIYWVYNSLSLSLGAMIQMGKGNVNKVGGDMKNGERVCIVYLYKLVTSAKKSFFCQKYYSELTLFCFFDVLYFLYGFSLDSFPLGKGGGK